jgi:hypothetical protein
VADPLDKTPVPTPPPRRRDPDRVRTTLVMRLAVWHFDRFVDIAETVIGATLGTFVTHFSPDFLSVPSEGMILETRSGRFRVTVEGFEERLIDDSQAKSEAGES